MRLDKKVKTQQQQNKNSNIKIIAGAWNRTRHPFHRSRVRYLWTTESTQSSDCSQASWQFQHSVSKHK